MVVARVSLYLSLSLKNHEGQIRSLTVTISGGGQSLTVSVTLADNPDGQIRSLTVSINGGGQSLNLTVNGNCHYGWWCFD